MTAPRSPLSAPPRGGFRAQASPIARKIASRASRASRPPPAHPPAVEGMRPGPDLDSPAPSPIVRAATLSLDARYGHAVDHERPIIVGDINRAVDPRNAVVAIRRLESKGLERRSSISDRLDKRRIVVAGFGPVHIRAEKIHSRKASSVAGAATRWGSRPSFTRQSRMIGIRSWKPRIQPFASPAMIVAFGRSSPPSSPLQRSHSPAAPASVRHAARRNNDLDRGGKAGQFHRTS